MLWTKADDTKIDVMEMTGGHLRNARWAMGQGRINPYKDHKCQIPFGQTFCHDCERFRSYRADWLSIFDREMTRRGLTL